MVLVYSFLAGLKTLTDYDLGWQLATGRWIIHRHIIPSTDVFSYTATGTPWIYPIGASIFFYLIYLVGNYALLSWLGALVCVLTTAVLLRRDSLVNSVLAVLAVPLIALRTTPRAEMFTVLFFAAFLALLWQHHRSGTTHFWLLPVLMLVWVNFHLGFVAGLGLLGLYIFVQFTDCVWHERRPKALQNLRQARPWLLMTCATTLFNPWGWTIYRAVWNQQRAMSYHSEAIAEWAKTPLNWTIFAASFSLRKAEGAFFVLLAVVVVAVVLGILQKRFGAVIFLCATTFLALRHTRLHVLFAVVVVIVGSEILNDGMAGIRTAWVSPEMRSISKVVTAIILLSLVFVRSADCITNRTYFQATSTASFGVGLSWWFPEGGAAFIAKEKIPGRVFNDYNEGGFLAWRLGRNYPDYIDGRAIPFGLERFQRANELMVSPPDSFVWQDEADRYNINIILVPLGRYDALQFFPELPQFCKSQKWSPVYLDETSAVFVRLRPETQELIARTKVDCASAPLPPPSALGSAATNFNLYANSAAVLQALGRPVEALSAADQALSIFPDCPFLHFLKGTLYEQANQVQVAEQEFIRANELQPAAVAPWATLATFYHKHGPVESAINAGEHAAALSPRPWATLLELGYTYLDAGKPSNALETFDRAASSLPANSSLVVNTGFLSAIAHGRAVAYFKLGGLTQAIACQEEATRLTPEDPESWRELATLYKLVGRFDDGQRAAARADSLGTRP